MSNSELDRNPVEVLAEEFLGRYRRGERPSVTEYVTGHPGLAAEIREVFPAVLALEGAGLACAIDVPTRCAASADEVPLPDRLGEFRIVREIGRGGMGVVYEAIQESLGRRVALKVLPRGELADTAALERFRREARAVAGLHHPNIVPVYGIGESGGHHYYAMQLIDGQTLDAVLAGVRRLRVDASCRTFPTTTFSAADRPPSGIAFGLVTGRFLDHEARDGVATGTAHPMESNRATEPVRHAAPAGMRFGDAPAPPVTVVNSSARGDAAYYRRIARAGLQVAEALAYAHDQGVLHRDIKPSNLLMDHEGNVWVVDFGLTKPDRSAGLSTSRDIVGTLRYMAPERFEGRSDRRSDVYGLGVTLYELLTLRPAFDAGDHARLIQQVLRGVTVPPRSLDRRIPRDLETVVLKAMARDPSARYATATALGDDLRRFLENRTVLARRSTLLGRTGRWCRRNPAIGTLLTSVVLLLAVIATYSSVAAARYKVQFERARIAEADGREKLFASYLAQARASRFSHRPGQRFAALEALAEAARIHRTPELRDEAIACTALPDLEEVYRSTWAFHGVRLAFDSSLERYACLDWDGVVTVRQVTDDCVVRQFPTPGPVGESTVLAFSPDGRHLAVSYALGGAHPLKVWSLDSDEPPLSDDGRVSAYSAPFSPDSHSIAVGHLDGTVVLLDLASRRAEARWDVGGPVSDLAFSPGGKTLAVSVAVHPPEVQVRAVASGAVLRTIVTPANCTVAWHDDGATLVAACEDTRIYLYDPVTGQQVGVLASHVSPGLFSVSQPDGTLLASNTWEGKPRLWRPRTGEMLLSLPSGGAIQFRADGLRLGTLAGGGRAVIYRVAEGRELRTLVREPARRHENISYSAIHPAGRLLAVAMTDGVGLWDLDSDAAVATLPIGYTQSLLFEPSGDLVTTGPGGTFRWPVRANPDHPDETRVGPPHSLAVGEGTGAVGRSTARAFLGIPRREGTVVLDLDRPDQPIGLGPQNDVRTVALSPDGQWAATGSHNSRDGIKVWSLPNGRLVRHFPNPGVIARAKFSPDGRWLVTWMGSDGLSRLWSVGDWREGPHVEGIGLAFSPDARLLAVGGDGVVRFVEVETGRVVANLEDPHQSRPMEAVFSPDGARLILSCLETPDFPVWDLRAVRRNLAAIGLDWDWPAFPDTTSATTSRDRLRVLIDLGDREFFRGGVSPQEVERLNAALEIEPDNVPALLRRAWIASSRGRDAEGVRDLTRALEFRPSAPGILRARGEVHLRMGRYRLGIADYEAALLVDPNRANDRNELAWAYATAPPPDRDLAKAVLHAQWAVRLAPAIASYRNTLGVSLCRLGRHGESVIELQASLAGQPRDMAAYDLFFLAICHWRLGDAGRAHACFERALRVQADARLQPERDQELRAIRGEAEEVLSSPLGPGSMALGTARAAASTFDESRFGPEGLVRNR